MFVETESLNKLCFMEEIFYKRHSHNIQLYRMEGHVNFCIMDFLEQIIPLKSKSFLLTFEIKSTCCYVKYIWQEIAFHYKKQLKNFKHYISVLINDILSLRLKF